MRSVDKFIATVAADGLVTLDSQRWTPLPIHGAHVRPGERWLFLITAEGLRPYFQINEADTPATDLLERLGHRLQDQPRRTREAIKKWAAEDPAAGAFLEEAIRAGNMPAEQLLQRLSELLQGNRTESAQAFVQWCSQDRDAASLVRTALEAAAIEDQDAPIILARRLGPNTIELPPVFTESIFIHVSPDGRRLSISRGKFGTRPPVNPIAVHGLQLFAPWNGAPYDILLRYDETARSFVGVVERHTTGPPSVAEPAVGVEGAVPVPAAPTQLPLDVGSRSESGTQAPAAEGPGMEAA